MWRFARSTMIGAGVLALAATSIFYLATQILGAGSGTDKAREAIEEDNAKPAFRGELGDFLVVGDLTSERPCPGPYAPVYDLSVIQQSELYAEEFGSEPQAGTCPDGTIVGVMSFGEVVLSRSYFFDAAQFPSDAPRERLMLMTVAGKPALAEVPIPDALVSSAQLIVIERFPEGDTPGIELGIVTVNDLDRAVALAEQIIGEE